MAHVKFGFSCPNKAHEVGKAIREEGFKTITCRSEHGFVVNVLDASDRYGQIEAIRNQTLEGMRKV